jgi:hypothetical protein
VVVLCYKQSIVCFAPISGFLQLKFLIIEGNVTRNKLVTY